MPLTTGQMLQHRYRIVSLLGQGGMGAVYRAWDTRLNIPMALKEMIPQPGLDTQTLAELREQFRQEATILARLQHPNLVNVTDFFEEGGNAYLVMNFVEGESLAQRIGREGALPEERVRHWATQLLNALAYCHSQGILHRDIKPQNIIIRPDGQPVLVDFGLVKLWNPRDPHTRTVMRGMGTPEYAPPEQYSLYGQHTDPRSDLYALGATLYHALTGRIPPSATDRMAMPNAFVKPRQIVSGLDPALEEAILRAMSLPIDQRFSSAKEMINAFRTVRASDAPRFAPPPRVEEHRPPPIEATFPPETEKKRSKLPVWVWLLGAAMFLCLCAGSIWAYTSLNNGNDLQAEATATARVRATHTARAEAAVTSTAEAAGGAATATAQAEAYARATATAQVVHATATTAASRAVQVWSPTGGSLDHEVDGYIEEYDAEGVEVADFIAQATFYNPYATEEGCWDYGFLIRHLRQNTHYAIRIIATGIHYSLVMDGEWETIDTGKFALNTEPGGANTVRIIATGPSGQIWINGQYAATLDLSGITEAGEISIATGIFNDCEIEGYSTDFNGFTVWSLDP